jgi:PIN domain nuclease of toxin-antitoxin system
MLFARGETPGDCARRLSHNRMADEKFRGSEVDRRLFSPSVALHVPHPLDVVVAQVLRRYAPLVTGDRKIAQAPGHRAAVEVI